MFYKIFGGLIVGAALALAFLAMKDEAQFWGPGDKAHLCTQLTPAEILAQTINDDLQVGGPAGCRRLEARRPRRSNRHPGTHGGAYADRLIHAHPVRHQDQRRGAIRALAIKE